MYEKNFVILLCNKCIQFFLQKEISFQVFTWTVFSLLGTDDNFEGLEGSSTHFH